jgi:hypothetical protein
MRQPLVNKLVAHTLSLLLFELEVWLNQRLVVDP